MITFIRRKFSNISLYELFYSQFEAFLFGGVSWIPGFLGNFMRWLVCLVCFKKLGGFIWIQPRVEVVNSNKIRAGKNVGINSGSYINARGGIVFGNYVLIGSNVTISSGEHPLGVSTGEIFERPTIPKEIVIEDGVWIGAGAVILPGVTLGRGSVIGANAVVTRSTEPLSVSVGIPARKLRSLPAPTPRSSEPSGSV